MRARSRSRWSGSVAWSLAACALVALAPAAGAQTPERGGNVEVRRAIPAAVTPPAEYRRAVDRGWRSEEGGPGHAYWQQGTTYGLEARLEPSTSELTGTARITYANNAPARLGTVWLHLHQNLHEEGVPRNEAQEITGGVRLTRVMANGQRIEERPLAEGPGYRVEGTLMELRPEAPLEQGDTLRLEIDWEVTLPQNGAGRMGHSEHEMYFVAYWFPKMAVFDNLRGWDAEPYLGNAEFYDGFADYTVALTVPEGWTVMATGELLNPQEVLSALTRERLAEAATSDERVTIVDSVDRTAGTATVDTPNDLLTYRFRADSVRDFAWTTSNVQRWDATSAVVADRDGDGAEDRVLIHSFWREDRAPLWAEQWLYGKQSIEHHSEYTGFVYPWPHMTSVEGADIIGGGMEFPMMTLIGPYTDGDPQALFNVTSHEIAHMWIPMVVASNEKRYAWIDEGSTTFLENQSRMAIWPGVNHHRVEAANYLQVAAAGQEQSMMRHGDWYEPGPGYGIASYSKPATLMVALRHLMGEDQWREAYRTFIDEWAYKHPTPWDFFRTFERFAGEDLDWFWTSYYYQTWTLDQAVGRVTSSNGGGGTVIIEDRSLAPFPVTVRVRTSAGGERTHEIPVEHWLAGNTEYEIVVPPEAGAITRVEIDPAGYAPDIDRSNNFWPRG